MLGPSGFFAASGPEHSNIDSSGLELIHSSEEGFSELYRICKEGRFFVYKVLKKQYRGNLMYEELLNKDFNIGFSLSHIGVCQYYAKIQHPLLGNCIVMEWVDGCSLEELIKTGNIDSRLCEKIICEICDALEYIHRKQVIHRDMKPENIMVTHNGQNVKIIDFGLSDADSYRTFKAPAGTRHYAAPELIAGETVDARCDIWALGVIINEISRKYRHVATRCLQHNRNKRYSSAAQIKKDIKNARLRSIKHIVIMFGMAAAAFTAVTYFTVTDRTHADIQPMIESAEDSIMESPAPVIVTPEQPDITLESQPTPKEKPAARSSDTPPADNIDASELDQLFKDAASSII